jgi:hypothetical protein
MAVGGTAVAGTGAGAVAGVGGGAEAGGRFGGLGPEYQWP